MSEAYPITAAAPAGAVAAPPGDLAAFGELLAWQRAGPGRHFRIDAGAAVRVCLDAGGRTAATACHPAVAAAVRDALAAWGGGV